MPSDVRLAATVILVRPAAHEFEVLLLRRSAKSPFVPGAFVFPGGKVDEADYFAPEGWNEARYLAEFRATRPRELPADVSAVTENDAYALVNAAVRELAEEANVAIEASRLALFSHWVTPKSEPRRYNTHFFIARAPHGANGAADAHETHDAQWLAPRAALAAHRAGEMHMIFPTIKHLERLAAFDSVEAVLHFAREKPILTITPELREGGSFDEIAMPASLEQRW